MSGKIVSSTPTPKTATRVPVFNQRGYSMRSGDVFKVSGKNNWWRFVAYVIPVAGESYIEAVELRDKGREMPRGGGRVKNGAVRCLDAGRIREVGCE